MFLDRPIGEAVYLRIVSDLMRQASEAARDLVEFAAEVKAKVASE